MSFQVQMIGLFVALLILFAKMLSMSTSPSSFRQKGQINRDTTCYVLFFCYNIIRIMLRVKQKLRSNRKRINQDYVSLCDLLHLLYNGALPRLPSACWSSETFGLKKMQAASLLSLRVCEQGED